MAATGENEQALRKIADMSRFIAVSVLGLHFYYFGYVFFEGLGWRSGFSDILIDHISATGIFDTFHRSKFWALALLAISLLGVRGRKEKKLAFKTALTYLLCGLLLYFLSGFFWLSAVPSGVLLLVYISLTSIGFLFVISGGALLSRIIRENLRGDIFNTEQESFPQEERLLENEYSINLPARYRLKRRLRNSWINIINPFRGILIMGTPGAGKSYFVIRHIISQHLAKGFSMFVYDFKFPDLSKIVYNHWLKNRCRFEVPPAFYMINFDDLSRSHRCNPLDPSGMTDITDAAESARTILLGLNREWIKKQGDFFVESAINFVTAIIWFLRKHEDGRYCTLPHVIELMQVDYEPLFDLLSGQREIEVLINPFMNAYKNDALEQLEGQIASAKVAMARLSSPQLYWVLSGNDFTLDINDPGQPKVVCMGNNPQKIQIYGAVLSLFVNRLVKLVNQKGKLKSSLVFDEFPTLYLNGIDSLMATARSNKVATTLGIQDLSQLRKDYGREQADVITGIAGNVISGQVTGESAKRISESIGRIMQERKSISSSSSGTSVSSSRQLESAVPASTISLLSSGQFVGTVADNPQQQISLKAFHAEILNDHMALKSEEDAYRAIPEIRELNPAVINRCYQNIKQDIWAILSKA